MSKTVCRGFTYINGEMIADMDIIPDDIIPDNDTDITSNIEYNITTSDNTENIESLPLQAHASEQLENIINNLST